MGKSVWGVMPKTPSSRRIFKDRLKTWIKSRGPTEIKAAKEKLERSQSQALDTFKNFLTEQLEEFGEEKAKDLSVAEFASAVESKRAANVRAQTEGQTPPRKKIKMYPNTRIPVQYVKPMNKHRDLKWLMDKFR